MDKISLLCLFLFGLKVIVGTISSAQTPNSILINENKYILKEEKVYVQVAKTSLVKMPRTFNVKKILKHRDGLYALQKSGNLYLYEQEREAWRLLAKDVYEAQAKGSHLFLLQNNALYALTNPYLVQENNKVYGFIQAGVSDLTIENNRLNIYNFLGEVSKIRTENLELLKDSPYHYLVQLETIKLKKSFEQDWIGGEDDLKVYFQNRFTALKVSKLLIGRSLANRSLDHSFINFEARESDQFSLFLGAKELDPINSKVLLKTFTTIDTDDLSFDNERANFFISNENLEAKISVTRTSFKKNKKNRLSNIL